MQPHLLVNLGLSMETNLGTQELGTAAQCELQPGLYSAAAPAGEPRVVNGNDSEYTGTWDRLVGIVQCSVHKVVIFTEWDATSLCVGGWGMNVCVCVWLGGGGGQSLPSINSLRCGKPGVYFYIYQPS